MGKEQENFMGKKLGREIGDSHNTLHLHTTISHHFGTLNCKGSAASGEEFAMIKI